MSAHPFEMSGEVFKVSDIKEITATFSVREFVLRNPGWKEGQFNDVKFQLNKKFFDIVDEGMIGLEATVKFFVNGRGSAKGYFNTLNAVGIELKQQPVQSAGPVVANPIPGFDGNPPNIVEDDVPW